MASKVRKSWKIGLTPAMGDFVKRFRIFSISYLVCFPFCSPSGGLGAAMSPQFFNL